MDVELYEAVLRDLGISITILTKAGNHWFELKYEDGTASVMLAKANLSHDEFFAWTEEKGMKRPDLTNDDWLNFCQIKMSAALKERLKLLPPIPEK